ncbi:MAG: tryptophan synthase subunit alpha [Armatimonadetes bacterium]|nr:tryptophan synthase subunit alpha [Armatimonadota bacterium]
MSAIADRFAELQEKKEKALVLFVTGGDPPLAELPAVLDALADGGADLIEVGIPFSDPIADGPTIQASSQLALDRGVTPRAILDSLRGFDRVPVVLMGYYNPVLAFGLDEYASAVVQAGVAGVIVSDLIPEEASDWIAVSREHRLDTVFLTAPTSTDARLDTVVQSATGFVYAVSRTGVTGAGQTVPPDVKDLVLRIKQRTKLPVCVGFGISTPDHVKMVCEVADGAVIGSWLVNELARNWENGKGRDRLVDQIRELKKATRG